MESIFFSLSLGPTVQLFSDTLFYLTSGCPAMIIHTVSPQTLCIPVIHYV